MLDSHSPGLLVVSKFKDQGAGGHHENRPQDQLCQPFETGVKPVHIPHVSSVVVELTPQPLGSRRLQRGARSSYVKNDVRRSRRARQ